MSSALFSSVWYRVASVKPRLRSHADIHRHTYRGQLWYILQDNVAGRYHRFSPSVYYLISLMDGTRTLQSIWEEAVGREGDEAPTQDETIQLMGQLHNAGVLASDATPDTGELYVRFDKMRKKQASQKLISPLSIKIPLLDPEKFLNRTAHWVTPLFGVVGFVLWFSVVLAGAIMGMLHWSALTENIVDTVMTPANLALLWLLFPVVKALHELGHGYAAKRWGGEIHEMGIMFLVFMPVPYVDASAASAFRERRRRLVVGAAGMLVELFLASLALFVWILVEPGLVRTVAYNTILIAGVSSIFFNANPLLRYDGYYMLADTIDIPNLATRANQYVGYLIQKYVFGSRTAKSPVSAPGEAAWFFFYSIASYIFRTTVMISIALFIAGKFFLFGIILAFMAIFNLIVLPVGKNLSFVFTSPKIQLQRTRAVLITLGSIFGLWYLLAMVPVPYWTNVEGVVWLPEDASVRAGTDCFVTHTLVEPGATVSRGEALVLCHNRSLEADLEVAKASVEEASAQYLSELNNDPYMAGIVKDKLRLAEADLARAEEKYSEFKIRSATHGRWILPLEQDLEGRFLHKGDLVGYVIQEGDSLVKIAVTQQKIDLVRDRTKSVEILTSAVGGGVYQGELGREVPGGSQSLPSAVLGSQGGGLISVDPRDDTGKTTFEKVFIFDIRVTDARLEPYYGARVHVRIHHDDEPLGSQWYRSLRQLLLGQFGV